MHYLVTVHLSLDIETLPHLCCQMCAHDHRNAETHNSHEKKTACVAILVR